MPQKPRGWAEWLLIAAALGAASMVALRAAIGPFQLGWGFTRVHSPLPMESAFWVATLGLWVLQPKASEPGGRFITEGNRFPAIHLTLLLCLIALAFAGNVADPFLSDDYILVGRPLFSAPAYLASLHTPGGDGAFRPLGNLYLDFVRRWAVFDPVKWHLVDLTFHIVNCALVFLVGWNLWRNATAALLTGLLFGLNGTHPEVVIWTSDAFDLLACFCVLLSIILIISGRRGSHIRFVLALCLVAAGILCKESAYAGPVIAIAVFSSRLRDTRVKSYLIGSVAICIALFAYRWYLFGGPGGYIDPATGLPQIMSVHLLTAAKAILVRIWAVLIFPVNWETAMPVWMSLAIGGTAAGILLLVASVRTSRPTSRITYSLMAATSLTVLPAIHLALIGDSAAGSRILYLPSVPFALLVGRLTLLPGARRFVAAALLLPATAVILEHNLGAWHRIALEAQTYCQTLAREPGAALDNIDKPVPDVIEGVFFFRNGLKECIAHERSAAR